MGSPLVSAVGASAVAGDGLAAGVGVCVVCAAVGIVAIAVVIASASTPFLSLRLKSSFSRWK